jgi:hypothetical protein
LRERTTPADLLFAGNDPKQRAVIDARAMSHGHYSTEAHGLAQALAEVG